MYAILVVAVCVVAAVSGQKTNGDVHKCMEPAEQNCQTQCLSQIQVANPSQVIACFKSFKSEMKAQEANCSANRTHHHDESSKPCFAHEARRNASRAARHHSKSSEEKKGEHSGEKHHHGLGSRYPQLQAFMNCSRTCMKGQMETCSQGCTAQRPPRPTGHPAAHTTAHPHPHGGHHSGSGEKGCKNMKAAFSSLNACLSAVGVTPNPASGGKHN